MTSQQATKKLIKHIDEGVAMEHNVLRMLDSMIRTTEDAEISRALEEHKRTTRKHIERLEQCLKMHGSSPSRARQAGGIVGARLKSVVDVARRDKAGRNARDGFVSEQLEVASYELLERIARKAGDKETAEVARQNRAEDEAMAKRLADNWDKFAELSLQGSGGGDGGSSGLRQRVSGAASKAGQNPFVLGAGAIAGGLLLGRRMQGSGGEQQQQERVALELLTKKELQERAESEGVEVQRGMTKQELVDALRSRGSRRSRPQAKANPVEVQRFLEAVRYPAGKDELLSEAARQGADQRVRTTLERLPKKRFQGPTEVSEAIGTLE
jgi:ferritin-like metal-binding protein YciE